MVYPFDALPLSSQRKVAIHVLNPLPGQVPSMSWPHARRLLRRQQADLIGPIQIRLHRSATVALSAELRLCHLRAATKVAAVLERLATEGCATLAQIRRLPMPSPSTQPAVPIIRRRPKQRPA